MDLGLKEKVVIVTGGASGIGEAITRACLDEQAHVVVLGRETDHTRRFLQEIHDRGLSCDSITLELGDWQACRDAVASVVERHGGIFAVVNNAGVNDGVGLAAGSPDAFMESLRNNLLHYYAVVHFALPALKQARGAIVNIGSKVAVTGQGGTSGYAAAKGAVLALTREWAVELLDSGIRVNAVLPAEVMTPLYESWIQTFAEPEAKLRTITERIPFEQRMTRPEEIAAAVVFLLSPVQSAHTTGQHLFVDGGYTHLDRAIT